MLTGRVDRGLQLSGTIRLVAGFVFLCSLIVLEGLHGVASGREITDMTGRKVIIPDTVTKVIGISPPATYLLYAMDPKLIAGLNFPPWDNEKKFVSKEYCRLPVVGGLFGQGRTINREVLLRVKPDFILYWSWKDDAVNEKFSGILDQLNIPRVNVLLDGIENYGRAFRFLGEILNMKERGERLAMYADETIAEAKAVAGRVKDGEKSRVYYAECLDGLCTEPEGSNHVELIPLGGGINVQQHGQITPYGMQKISMEQLVLYAPEVVLVKEKPFFESIYQDPRWQAIPAVRNRQVYFIPQIPFNWFDRPPSFMRLLGVKWLLNLLHPELYRIDMQAETKSFYKLFLQADLDDQQVKDVLAQ